MRRSTRPRETVNLSKSVRHQVNIYSLAASAAGVAALSSVQPAHAKIVYTPAHVKILMNQQVLFDLNHDGTPEFGIKNFFYGGSESAGGVKALSQANQFPGVSCGSHGDLFDCALALPKGAKVGPKQPFLHGQFGTQLMALSGYQVSDHGQWFNVGQAYLGIKFAINGKTHFGWARVKISHAGYHFAALVTGYAYETIPNKPIITGKTKGSDVVVEPATLGHLAAGAVGPRKSPSYAPVILK